MNNSVEVEFKVGDTVNAYYCGRCFNNSKITACVSPTHFIIKLPKHLSGHGWSGSVSEIDIEGVKIPLEENEYYLYVSIDGIKKVDTKLDFKTALIKARCVL